MEGTVGEPVQTIKVGWDNDEQYDIKSIEELHTTEDSLSKFA